MLNLKKVLNIFVAINFIICLDKNNELLDLLKAMNVIIPFPALSCLVWTQTVID